MMMSRRRATQGFNINADINRICQHPSITELYNYSMNSHSLCLLCYKILLPQIGPICCPQSCPDNQRINVFEDVISYHSARSRTKDYSRSILVGQLYTKVANNAPELLHLLPSILSPQTSYPLVSLCRSNPNNQLPNWATKIALQQKLQLPVFDNRMQCKCGTTHDPWGNHTFKCRHISKMPAHTLYTTLGPMLYSQH